MSTEPKYWAFISYSHQDEEWAAWLHGALERYRVPRALVGKAGPAGTLSKRLAPVFRDRDELPSASDLHQQILDALSQSRFLIVVCSPSSAASLYVNEEIQAFRRLGRSKQILCLVVDGEPGASRHPERGLPEAFPPALLGEVDGHALEPLAADARPDKDGKGDALLKILAGMLGVGLDDLKHREARRRKWRIARWAAMCAAVVGVVAGVYWDRQRVADERGLVAKARAAATRSLDMPERDARQRLEMALHAIQLTREPYGYVLPEAENALHKAISQIAIRGEYSQDEDAPSFGGWTWPVAVDHAAQRIVAPAAIGPTIVLDGDASVVATLLDEAQPYQNDYVARFSVDESRFLTGGADGIVRTWTRDGAFVSRFRAHAAEVLTIDQSDDGRLTLTVGCDDDRSPSRGSCRAGSARLWDGQSRLAVTFSHKDARVVAAAFSPDGQHIATADHTGAVALWTVAGETVLRKSLGSHWVSAESFDPEGRFFLSGGCPPFVHSGMFSPLLGFGGFRLCPGYLGQSQPFVQLLDKTGLVSGTWPGRLSAFDRVNGRFAIASESCDEKSHVCSGTVKVWAAIGTLLTQFGTPAGIVDLRFSPDGQLVVVATDDGTITLAGSAGDVEPYRVGAVRGRLTSVRFSGDGSRLVSVSCPNGHQGACLRRSIQMWDPNGSLTASRATRKERDPLRAREDWLEGKRPLIRVARDASLVSASEERGAPSIWDRRSDRVLTLPVADRAIRWAQFDRSASRLATLGARLEIWDTRSGKALTEPPMPDEDLRGLFVAASRQRIVAIDGQGNIWSWMWDGTMAARQTTGAADVTSIDSSPTDEAIVTAHLDGRVRLWDERLEAILTLDAGALNKPPDEETEWIGRRYDTAFHARFTKDGQHIVVVGPKNISLWDREGKLRWSHDVDPLERSAPQTSPDRVFQVLCTERGRGATIGSLSGCYDTRAHLWDLEGHAKGQLDPGVDAETMVDSIVLTAAGNRIATADDEGVVRVWDSHGNLIERLPGVPGAVAFAEGADQLFTLDGQGVIRVWATGGDLDSMIETAKRLLVHVE
jgi:WD40 repeat protein